MSSANRPGFAEVKQHHFSVLTTDKNIFEEPVLDMVEKSKQGSIWSNSNEMGRQGRAGSESEGLSQQKRASLNLQSVSKEKIAFLLMFSLPV